MTEKKENITAYEQLIDLITLNLKRDIPKYFPTVTTTETVTVTQTVIKYDSE